MYPQERSDPDNKGIHIIQDLLLPVKEVPEHTLDSQNRTAQSFQHRLI